MNTTHTETDVIAERRGAVGFLTLNRPRAMNALSLGMVRQLTSGLTAWREDPDVLAVVIRGAGKDDAFGNFCAGGDIRFFHTAALSGDPALDDFFTEEYRLNHLIATYPKPYIALMDGVVMGGGMGISQGASLRVVTERTRMAMPETGIGLFPDVGGSYFLSRCPGRVGEYLGLTGLTLGPEEALAWGLADGQLGTSELPVIWETLAHTPFESGAAVESWVQSRCAHATQRKPDRAEIDAVFGLSTVQDMVRSLEASSGAWATETLTLLRKRSPLMLHVVLEQIRRGREMGLADALRMERVMVHQCFHLRPGAASETVEGIRALAIDKDHRPRWYPSRLEDVQASEVKAFFQNPWGDTAHHPLAHLG